MKLFRLMFANCRPTSWSGWVGLGYRNWTQGHVWFGRSLELGNQCHACAMLMIDADFHNNNNPGNKSTKSLLPTKPNVSFTFYKQ
jgi:hypothetical protein